MICYWGHRVSLLTSSTVLVRAKSLYVLFGPSLTQPQRLASELDSIATSVFLYAGSPLRSTIS